MKVQINSFSLFFHIIQPATSQYTKLSTKADFEGRENIIVYNMKMCAFI